MTSTERVRNTILGKTVDRTPIYGWVAANLLQEITEKWGSVVAFEDAYEFDMSHIFGGPAFFNRDLIEAMRRDVEELTPDLLIDVDFHMDADDADSYKNLEAAIAHHKQRDRFCYVQTPGFFEQFNDIFGIQNQLIYLLMYPDELYELYSRQADWTIKFADHCIARGADMIHLSDDWGSQKDLMFNPALWRSLIRPHLKRVIDHVHEKGVFVSLHSDGCIRKVTDELRDSGIDLVHPWQESAGMDYDFYLQNYANSFAILGGVCVQTSLGILPREKLEAEIRRVFQTLKGKRWICCTTHFVQNHCSVEDLEFAYDLIYKLARQP